MIGASSSSGSAESSADGQPIRPDEWYIDKRLEGTPGYLPPEILQDRQAPNFLTDSWSLGCLLIFCLCGRPRYYGNDRQEVLQQIFHDFNLVSTTNDSNGIQTADDIHVRFDESSSFEDVWKDMIPGETLEVIRARKLLSGLLNLCK